MHCNMEIEKYSFPPLNTRVYSFKDLNLKHKHLKWNLHAAKY